MLMCWEDREAPTSPDRLVITAMIVSTRVMRGDMPCKTFSDEISLAEMVRRHYELGGSLLTIALGLSEEARAGDLTHETRLL